MPVYPGDTLPSFNKTLRYEESGINMIRINLSSHTGTHLDCPAHLTELQLYTDNIPINNFMGTGWSLDCRKHIANNEILDTVLTEIPSNINPDYLLFYTGHDVLWGKDEYFQEFPVFSFSLAKKLAELPLRGVGVDVISIDPSGGSAFNNHRALLHAQKIIIENLKNIDKLLSKEFTFLALPLKIAQGDGSPVRAIAIT